MPIFEGEELENLKKKGGKIEEKVLEGADRTKIDRAYNGIMEGTIKGFVYIAEKPQGEGAGGVMRINHMGKVDVFVCTMKALGFTRGQVKELLVTWLMSMEDEG